MSKKENEAIMNMNEEDIRMLRIKLDAFWFTIVREHDDKLKDEDLKYKYKLVNIVDKFFKEL